MNLPKEQAAEQNQGWQQRKSNHLVVKGNGRRQHGELAVGIEEVLSSCAHSALHGKHGLDTFGPLQWKPSSERSNLKIVEKNLFERVR